MPAPARSQQPRLLEEVRRVLRLHHYSLHTERSYARWIVQFVRFHNMASRQDLLPAEPKIQALLTHLAVDRDVAAATQNLAMNALVFLYKRVLNLPLTESIDAVRADRKSNVPVVMTREEVAAVISLLQGTPQLVAKLLYGSGLRIMEAVRLRVKDVDFGMKQITVRSGKGDKDRITTFPVSITPLLKNHLARVQALHQQDLARGCGEVYLPHALSVKFRNAGKEWGWQYLFPAREVSLDPRSGITRRHHIDPSVINKAIKNFEEAQHKRIKGSLRKNSTAAKLSTAFMKSTGLLDKKGNAVYVPQPVARWKKRKLTAEKKLGR